MGLKDAKERKKSKEREKKKRTNISKRVKEGSIEGIDEAVQQMISGLGSTAPFIEDKELWMMGDKTYETTAKERKKMERTEDEAMADGGKVMRYYNEGGGVYGYNHGGGVNKHQGQYDIQVKKIKGKGKVL